MKDGDRTRKQLIEELAAMRERIAVLERSGADNLPGEAFRESEVRYRFIAENVGDVIWQLDGALRCTYVSPSVRRFLGYEPEELIGSHLFSLLAPESVDRVKALRAEGDVLGGRGRAGDRASVELVFIGKDGSTLPMEVRYSPYFNEAGELVSYQGVARDITERKRAEAALRESEERYRIAIENSNDGVAIVQGNRYAYVNQKFLDMFGYDRPKSLNGKKLLITVHPEDRARVTALNRKRQRDEPVPSRYEFKGLRRDGTVIYVEASATRIVYRGKPATLAYLRDTTGRKQAEEELRQAHKMQAIGTLAGGIAHDFSNILSAIIGFSELALRDIGVGSPARRYLELILKAGVRGKDLTRQILTFSRKTTHAHEPLHLLPLVEETAGLLKAALPSTIRLEVRAATDCDEILADSSQVQQVLLNLATNAAHAMAESGGSLEITVESRMLDAGSPVLQPDMVPGPHVVLGVRDTGCGMDETVRQRIFDPFFTTKPAGQGTGMGLSVAYGIVRSHRGAIAVSSEPGKGSAFTVFFPHHGKVSGAPSKGALPPPRGKERILLVDDEEIFVEVARQMLARLGYRVFATTDCGAALRRFTKAPRYFDLVIADYTMPGMTGTDLAGEVLKLRPGMPIIVCTGYSDTISPERAKAMGIRELAMKPFTIRELATLVRQALEPPSALLPP
jgi:PAS domain S-box-containing protein